jgi:hypothetical protein
VPLSYRRRKCETVEQMIAQRWDVISHCRKCDLMMVVDLRLIARIKGLGFSLWNKKSRCRRVGCGGFVEFQARSPDMSWHEALEAPWPDGKPPKPEPPAG